MKKWLTPNFFSVLILAAVLIMAATTGNRQSAPGPAAAEDERILPQIIKPIPVKGEYSFAGEALPLGNFDVRERLERELMVNSYWHSSTALNIKKSYRFFPIIEPILREYGVPDDFKYLAVAESNLSNATSPAGAKGLWQFMKPVGEAYGLEVGSEVDERFHYEKATRAACAFLLDLKARFGSWALVAAAYNMGSTRLARELENQRASNYFDLNLNEETSRYLFRIVAIKEVIENPQDFGFYLGPDDGYRPLNDYRTVVANQTIANLGDFATEQGISYRMLKLYNPWLLSYSLTVKPGKTYELKIPK